MADYHIPPFAVIARAFRQAERTFLDDVREFAEERKRRLVQRIEAQGFASFELHPLSASWLARKNAAGADSRVLIATHHYLDNIIVEVVQKGPHHWTVCVYPDPDAKAKDLNGKITDTPLQLVARTLEFGSASRGIPPRPHWGPFIRETKDEVRDFRKQEAAKLSDRARYVIGGGFRITAVV